MKIKWLLNKHKTKYDLFFEKAIRQNYPEMSKLK